MVPLILVFFFKIVLATLVLLPFHIHFRISHSYKKISLGFGTNCCPAIELSPAILVSASGCAMAVKLGTKFPPKTQL